MFDDQPIPLGASFNSEQLLDFALEYISQIPQTQKPHFVAEQIVVTYIINGFVSKGEEFTEDDVLEAYKTMVCDYIINRLVREGYMDVDISESETIFTLTDKGKAYAESINKVG